MNHTQAASETLFQTASEKSTNYSIGFVAHPLPRLQITADAYDIDLKDRIETTSYVLGSLGSSVVSQGVLNAIMARGVTLDSGLAYTGISLFTNAANTTTAGVDVTANYASDFSPYGHVDWTLGFNYNHTTINRLGVLPSAVTNTTALAAAFGQAPGAPILGLSSVSALTTETPEEKVILQALWSLAKWSVNLRGTYYGVSSGHEILDQTQKPYTLTVNPAFLVDLDISYRLTRSIKLQIGANNLFNQVPAATPNVDGLPANNNDLVYGVPTGGAQGGFAPYGVAGGYYYGRVTYAF